jgi:hypothetical protein
VQMTGIVVPQEARHPADALIHRQHDMPHL